jgi:hypothetical protein
MLSFSNITSTGFTATDPMGNSFDVTTTAYDDPTLHTHSLVYGAEVYRFSTDFVTFNVNKMVQHHQNTPATTWTIIHNIGDVVVATPVITSSGELQYVLPLAVTVIDSNTLELTFSSPTSGIVQVR